MADFITGIQTEEGVKKYDYGSLANLPSSVTDSTNTVISPNADYAEVGEWADGNTGKENRLGYFIAVAEVGDNTIKIRKATSHDDVRGVSVYNPAFSGNASEDKYGQDGELLPQYNYVGIMGIIPVIDNGRCTVNGRCMPADDGTAVPSSNNMGYAVLERVDATRVLIAVEPAADMVQRIKTDMEALEALIGGGGGGGSDVVSPTVTVTSITGGNRITITDKNGTKTVDVMDGADGSNGTNGKDGKGIKSIARTSGTGAAGTTDTYTITYTDNTTSTFTVYNGKNGTNGTNGSNGVSVSSVAQTTTSSADGGSNIITVTLSNGTTSTFTVKNGSKGSAGTNGTNGSNGKDGNGIKSAVLNADYTLTLTFDNGTTYTTPSIRGATGATGTAGTNGKDGTSVTVKSVSESTADGGSNVVTFSDGKTLTVKNGKTGAAGADGKDYVLTDADRVEMVAMVLEAIGGNPIYGYIDENYHIVLSGNMPDGTYTASYEDENGSIVPLVGQLVKDTNVYYSVTSDLTNCTNSNGTKTVVEGGSYSATITANSGYELKSVVATMGGSPVSVSGGKINIASVTGDIVITAVAEEATVEIVNKIPLSTDASGNPYNNGQGWKTGYRLSGSSGNESAQTGTEVTGFIPVKYGDTVYLKGITDDGTRVIGFYKSDYSMLATSTHKTAFGGAIGGETVSFVVNGNIATALVSTADIAFMRVSATEITADSIITVNEPIE